MNEPYMSSAPLPNESLVVYAARTTAVHAHRGQFLKDGKTPYITHCAKVAGQFNGDVEAQAVAWLHDVVELTSVTLRDLHNDKRLTPVVPLAVRYLTRDKGQPYVDYIASLAAGDIVKRVKIAEIAANLEDDPTPEQRAKYDKALRMLGASGIADKYNMMKVTTVAVAPAKPTWTFMKDKQPEHDNLVVIVRRRNNQFGGHHHMEYAVYRWDDRSKQYRETNEESETKVYVAGLYDMWVELPEVKTTMFNHELLHLIGREP